jgi:hypothetical protein
LVWTCYSLRGGGGGEASECWSFMVTSYVTLNANSWKCGDGRITVFVVSVFPFGKPEGNQYSDAGTGWTIGVLFPAGKGYFSIRRRVQTGGPGAHPMGIGGKAARACSRPLACPSAEVKNECSCTSTSSIHFHDIVKLLPRLHFRILGIYVICWASNSGMRPWVCHACVCR